LDKEHNWQAHWPTDEGSEEERLESLPLAVEMPLEHRQYGKLVLGWRLLDPRFNQEQPQGQPGGENDEGGVPQLPEGMSGAP
ncbi:type II secretion system protein GspJ, partial [Pseudomonas aeruginosa]